MKKVLLVILAIAFALSFTSCDDQEKKEKKPLKGDAKLAHQHRRW
jgi:hypothetical protein